MMLQSIDHERQQRRQKRINKAIPDRGLSTLSMASNTTSEFKELLLEKDETGKLRSLQSKILEKRKRRLATSDKHLPQSVHATATKKNYLLAAPIAAELTPVDELDRARLQFEGRKQVSFARK